MPLRAVPREHPAAASTGCSPSVTATFRVGSRAYFERRDTPWLLGWAAEKVAGGVGVGHRVGVVDVEDQGKVERVGAGGQGFLQDAVAPDVFEADAVQLVLVEVVGAPVRNMSPGANGGARQAGYEPAGADTAYR